MDSTVVQGVRQDVQPNSAMPPYAGPPAEPPKPRWWQRRWAAIAIGVAGLLIGVGAGASGSAKTKTVTRQAAAQTVTQTAAGPTQTVVHVRKVPGPTTTVTQTVQAATPAPSAGSASSGGGPAGTQHFSGANQKDLGTINVPADSTISWTCPGCGGTNFQINNAAGDANQVPTNGLDQTSGVDPLPAGTYHTVVVDTDGGSWTVTVTPG